MFVAGQGYLVLWLTGPRYGTGFVYHPLRGSVCRLTALDARLGWELILRAGDVCWWPMLWQYGLPYRTLRSHPPRPWPMLLAPLHQMQKRGRDTPISDCVRRMNLLIL